MGLSVYVENQIHARRYVGAELSETIETIWSRESTGILSGIHSHGDTMFNLVQLRQLDGELDEMIAKDILSMESIVAFKDLIQVAMRERGYLWISGD